MPSFYTDEQVQIYYEVDGEGLPLVFIHPPAMGHVVFNYQRRLSQYFKVILYDLRGHGNSSLGEPLGGLSAHSRDLRALLDHLSIEQAVIVGYSSGSSIAQKFVLDYPDRVKALIFSGGFPKVSTWLLKREFQLGLFIVKYKQMALLAKFLAGSHAVTPHDYQMLLKSNLMADPGAAYNYYFESFSFDFTAALKDIIVPVLALYGSRSFYFHPYQMIYEELLPNFISVMVDHAFHQLPTYHYPEFNGAIRQFLKEI